MEQILQSENLGCLLFVFWESFVSFKFFFPTLSDLVAVSCLSEAANQPLTVQIQSALRNSIYMYAYTNGIINLYNV